MALRFGTVVVIAMGRSPKVGLDYFRLDCHLDRKFQLIEAEYGLKGFAVVVKLYQMIYSELGYYCEWDEDVALMFGDRTRLGVNVVSEIVNAAIKRGLFDKHMFEEYHILTSTGIQKWYFESISRRERVEVIREYLLVSDSILPKTAYIKAISADINAIYASRNTHSTVQYSKEDKREEETRAREDIPIDSDWVRFVKLYEANIGPIPYSGYAMEELQSFYDDLGYDVLDVAIRATISKHPYNPQKYLSTILKKWVDSGVKTVSQAEASIEAHERTIQAQKRTSGSHQSSSTRRTYDYSQDDENDPYKGW